MVGAGSAGDADLASSGSLVRPLLRTDDLLFAEFHCPPGDERWAISNNIGSRPHVVFPLRPVFIRRRESICADSTVAVLYDAGQEYQRRMVDPAGDRCTFVALSLRLLGELTEVHAPSGRAGHFPAGHAPVAAPIWLSVQMAVALARSWGGDPLSVEERILLALGAVLTPALAPTMSGGARTAVADRVDTARVALGRNLGGPMSLADLGRELHVSPYHLARQFRAVTGSSVHAYRTQLQVRAAAAAMLGSPKRELTAIAASHGFASHSHFTKRFSAAFGATPSAVRHALVGPPPL